MTPSPAPGSVDVRPPPAAVPMNAGERRATASLASIYGLRLLGMFVILPVFALYAETLEGGASHTMIGIALGAYGLTQAILQIPFGWASDRFLSRRRLIALAVHEGIVHESNHEVEKRNSAWAEARTLIREEYKLGTDRLADTEVERVFLDLKRKLLKSIDEDQLALA